MNECYELAIRVEDQQWYKDMMMRIRIKIALSQIQENCKLIVESMTPVFKHIVNCVSEAVSAVWEEVKPKIEDLIDSFQELSKLADEFYEEDKTNKDLIVYTPPRNSGRMWYYNQYQRKMIRDKRNDMKHFTIYKRE